MKAYHNDIKVKKLYVDRVIAHQKADEVVKGQYWENGRGCAVGCTIHSSNHKAYETELGIPEWLARVEDVIFEGLPNNKAKKWPLQFLKAIKPGVDLDKAKPLFIVFVLKPNLKNFDNKKHPAVTTSIKDCIKLWSRKDIGSVAWETERKRVGSAASSAARSAARSAAYAASSAAYAASSAAYAAYAASSAAYAASSAAYAARSAAYAAYAASSAARSAYVKFANELLKIIRGLK